MIIFFRRLTVFTIFLAFGSLALAQEDPRTRRLAVRNGQLYRGTNPTTLRSVKTPDFFVPGTSDEEIAKTFVRVSDCGATSVWFDLEGLSADGTSIDPANVAALLKVKAASMYPYISPVCRVFGAGTVAGAEARLNAVRTAAKTFPGGHGMLYWIDGPNSDALVAEFKRVAPRLMVLAARGGDVDVVEKESDAAGDRPAMLVGAIPTAVNGPVHCLMPAGDASYAAFETANTDPSELEPLPTTTVGLSDEEIEEGFVSLFNGRSMEAWIVTGRDKEAWTIRDGTMEFVRPGGGVVRSRERYDNFTLRLEWKLFTKGGNSGLFLRAPRTNRASKIGFEFQMMGDYGEAPGMHTTGAIYSVVAPTSNASNPVGEWNAVEIMLDGPHYVATLNGEVVQDLNFDENPELKHRLRRGFIGLQDHRNRVAFRNIRIKKL